MNTQEHYSESLEVVKKHLRDVVNTMSPQMAKEWINELQREINKANDDINSRPTYGGNGF